MKASRVPAVPQTSPDVLQQHDLAMHTGKTLFYSPPPVLLLSVTVLAPSFEKRRPTQGQPENEH